MEGGWDSGLQHLWDQERKKGEYCHETEHPW